MPPTLRLPLEVIERILYLALGGDVPLATPFTCDELTTPPASTAHLLLVSKGINEIALPFYWRSVAVLHSKDWIQLWHPTTGVFAGPGGRDRASWVKEIRINAHREARIPIDRATVLAAYSRGWNPRGNISDQEPTANDVLVVLNTAPLPRLERVCFFNNKVEHDDGQEDEGKEGSGEATWERESRDIWTAEEDDRWDTYVEEASAGSEQEDDNGYGYDVEPDKDAWRDQDESDFLDIQESRELDLDKERQSIVQRLLHLVDEDPPAVHVPADGQTPRLVLVKDAPETYRINVYGVYYKADKRSAGKTLGSASPSEKRPYDFVGILEDDRALALESLKKFGSEALQQWRWVDEDGTKELLV